MPKSHYDQRQSPQPGGRRRLGLETLEDRTVLSTASPTISLQGLAVGSNYDPNHVLVEFRRGATPHAERGTSLGQALSAAGGLYEVQLQHGVTVAAALKLYQADAGVLKAEPDYLLGVSSVPNDPSLGDQWNLQNTGNPAASIHAEQAWNVTQGSSQVIVAINDTGVDYTHPDLYQNIWINQKEIPQSRMRNLVDYYHDGFISMRDLNDKRNQGYGKITDLNGNGYIDGGDLLQPMARDSQGRDTGWGGWACGSNADGSGYVDDIIGWNFFANNNNPYDDFGHGTHVAGTIGAAGNNGVGVAGIAWNVQLMPIKFLGAGGSGTVAQFIQGLDFAVDHGARISNNSWSGAAYSTILSGAIDGARSHGDIFVAAAGNYGTDNDARPTYPASFPLDNVVSVAATDRYDQLASFSDYGRTTVQLGAPGVDILSTKPGGTYGYLSGTSQATPQVAGVLALVWSLHPEWNYKQVIDQVLNTVDKIPSLAGKTTTGGRLDAAAAVGSASVASVPPAHVVGTSGWGPTAYSLSQITVWFDRSVSQYSVTGTSVSVYDPSWRQITVTGVSPVSGSGGRAFTVTFSTQTGAGDYKLHVGAGVRDLSGIGVAASDTTLTVNKAPAPQLTPKPTPTPKPAQTPLRLVGAAASGPTAYSMSQITVWFDRAVSPSSYASWSASLEGPDGRWVGISGVRPAEGGGGRSFVLTFATQSRPGGYWLHVGGALRDAAGVSLAPSDSTLYVKAAPPVSKPGPTPSATPLRLVGAAASGPTAYSMSQITVWFDRAVSPSSYASWSASLEGPDGRWVGISGVRPAEGGGGRSFVLTFATQSRPGGYWLHVGGALRDAAGVSLAPSDSTLYVKAAPPVSKPGPTQTPTPTSGRYVSSSKVNIPKGGRGVSVLYIADNVRIKSLKVEINLSHPHVGDLLIHVQAPDGTNIVLANRKGGPSSDMTNTVFDDNAGTYIGLGRGPFTGSYQPDAQLSNLIGKSAQGVWKLWVEDLVGSNRGTLNGWQLIVN